MKNRPIFRLVAWTVLILFSLAGWVGLAQKAEPKTKRKLAVSTRPGQAYYADESQSGSHCPQVTFSMSTPSNRSWAWLRRSRF